MNIHISIDAENAEQAREQLQKLLGTTALTPAAQPPVEEQRQTFEIPDGKAAVLDGEGRATGALRERGKASSGSTRRTKAEIAEDDAADKADAALRAAGEETGAVVADKQVAGISTGEARVDPDDPEDAAQDAADEAAETAVETGGKLTVDNVRTALGAYVKKYGMDAAQQDGPKLISMVCGEGKVKMSDIPDDQAVLQKVVDGIGEMLTKNPFERQAA